MLIHLFFLIHYVSALTNSTLYTLCRNSDMFEILNTIINYEARFNHQFHYDWVFLNDQDFDETFKMAISNAVSGTAKFGKISKEHWEIPDWIDTEKMEQNIEMTRQDPEGSYPYFESKSYRNMCRFESGFFAQHPLLMEYDYFWRVEPGVKLYCDINYDIFDYMITGKYKYGFTISVLEYPKTIPTLFESFRDVVNNDQTLFHNDENYSKFIIDYENYDYNLCHFWTNFEIGDLNLFRSKEYLNLFHQLDKKGGFYYERWGDAPVRTLILSSILKKPQIKRFKNIGYEHLPYLQCPTDLEFKILNRCSCDTDEDITYNWFSCSRIWDTLFDPYDNTV